MGLSKIAGFQHRRPMIDWLCRCSISIIAILITCEANAQGPTIQTTTLSGQLFGDRFKQPLAGAHVVLASDRTGGAGHVQFETVTDASGRFRLAEIPPGTYHLFGAHQKLLARHDVGSLLGEASPLIHLAPGDDLNVVVHLPQGYSIQGVAELPSGDPATGAKIEAIASGALDDGLLPMVVRTAVADSAGRFELSSLRAGKYAIRATFTTPSVPIDGRSQVRLPVYATAYVPASARSLEEASPIELSDRNPWASIAITFKAASPLSLDGIIRMASSERNDQDQVHVSLVSIETASPGLDAQDRLAIKDDRFSINPVAGAYCLFAGTISPDGFVKSVALERLGQINDNKSDITLTLGPTATVFGTLKVFAEGPAETPNEVVVRLIPIEKALIALGLVHQARIASTGEFSFSGVIPGRYRIKAEAKAPNSETLNKRGPDQFSVGDDVKEMHSELVQLDNKKATSEVITLGSGQSSRVEIGLFWSTGKASGVVKHEAAEPIGGVVFAVPVEREKRADSTFVRIAEMDQRGAWAISNLRPGRYLFGATNYLTANAQELDQALLERLLVGAKEHDVVKSSLLDVDLTMTPR